MPVEVLVALVSVIVGYGGSVITVELQHRRIRERAREDEKRRFQREALMELQEHVAHLMRQNYRFFLDDLRAYRETGQWGRHQVDNEIAEEQRAAVMQVKLLSHRVADPRVRTLAEELLSAGTDMGVAENQSDAERQRHRAGDAAIALLDRLGELLRDGDLHGKGSRQDGASGPGSGGLGAM